MGAILAGLLVFALFLGPLVARMVLDRRLDRANAIAADLRAAIRHRLSGDSLVSVSVQPEGVLTPGRVMLFAPSGYQSLIERVWSAVALRMPPGYELVVRAPASPAMTAPTVAPLTRAA